MKISRSLCVLVVSSSMALAGCGYNQIRLDRGGLVSQAGANAILSTKLFLKQVKETRDQANIALVASDESCSWGEKIILRGDLRPVPKPPARVPFCLKRGDPASKDLGDVEISLAPVADAAIKPTLNGLDALSTYLDAVNEILDTEAPDVAGKLQDAYQKALTAQSDLAAITSASIEIIPTLKDDQVSAIAGLIKLIDDLSAEQRKVKELRTLVNKQNGDVQIIVGLLRKSVKAWGDSSLAGDLQLNDSAYVTIGRQLAADPPIYKGFDARRDVLVRIVQARRNAKASSTVAAAVDQTFEKLSKAQENLFNSFTANPNWSAEERKKAAKLNRERILAALHALASVVTAF